MGAHGVKQFPLISTYAAHSFQKLEKKVKEEEHRTRLHRYSLMLQRENFRK